MSEETQRLMEQRREAYQRGSQADLTNLSKQIQKSMRKDKRKQILDSVSQELDIRDHWMGIRTMRKDYQPIPLSMKDMHGRHVPFKDRAEMAAQFLGTKIWGQDENHRSAQATAESTINSGPVNIDIGEVTMDELLWAIRKLKRRKAAGPDRVPIEFLKEMEEPMLQNFLELHKCGGEQNTSHQKS